MCSSYGCVINGTLFHLIGNVKSALVGRDSPRLLTPDRAATRGGGGRSVLCVEISFSTITILNHGTDTERTQKARTWIRVNVKIYNIYIRILNCRTLQPIVVVEWLTLLLRNRKVPMSNLSPMTGHRDCRSLWFFSVPPVNYQDSTLN
jgi:hypothetical protein